MKILLDSDVTVPAGVALRLTPEQIQKHRYSLEKLCTVDAVFIGRQPLEFKAGEVIEISGELQSGILPIYDKIKNLDDQVKSVEPSKANEPPVSKPRKPKKPKAADPSIMNTEP